MTFSITSERIASTISLCFTLSECCVEMTSALMRETLPASSYSAEATPEQNAEAAIANLGVSDPAGNQPEIIWETVVDGEEVTLTGAPALEAVAQDVGEPSVVSRTGGAPTLAVGMANIMHNVVGGKAMMSFWYHFAIMFEALFILSAVDAVTRVARFQLGDAIGNLVPKFRDPGWRVGSWLTTGVVVAAWGSLLLMGVTDPNGGIRTLFPLFGIANQLIAACALTIVTVWLAAPAVLVWTWRTSLPARDWWTTGPILACLAVVLLVGAHTWLDAHRELMRTAKLPRFWKQPAMFWNIGTAVVALLLFAASVATVAALDPRGFRETRLAALLERPAIAGYLRSVRQTLPEP